MKKKCRGWILWHPRCLRTMTRLGLGWSYAEKNGGPVLRTETGWTKVNGIWINTPWWACWLLFRRRFW